MEVLIIEDEPLAAERLAILLHKYDPSVRIMERLDSVEEAVRWFDCKPAPDLLLLDIRLSDGLSFDIFEQTTIPCPIIFTTAYDQYAIQAFKVNSIDYLLKPIAYNDLSRAMGKLKHLIRDSVGPSSPDLTRLAEAIRRIHKPFKTRFIIRFGDRIQFKQTEEIAYFYADGKIVYLVTPENRRYIIEYTLEEMEELLDPVVFYRLNRKFTVRIEAVKEIRLYSGSRLKVLLHPMAESEVIVSREKATEFKNWLDR